MKIGGGIFARGSLDGAADSDLALELGPVKTKRRVGVGFKLPALFAVVVREETEAAGIHTLEQNDAHRRFAVGCGGGETHRIDVANVGSEGRGEPGPELFYRI